MKKYKYQRIYNAIANEEFRALNNLKIIKNKAYAAYISSELNNINNIIDAILRSDINDYNHYMQLYCEEYAPAKNYQIKNKKCFDSLRNNIINKLIK